MFNFRNLIKTRLGSAKNVSGALPISTITPLSLPFIEIPVSRDGEMVRFVLNFEGTYQKPNHFAAISSRVVIAPIFPCGFYLDPSPAYHIHKNGANGELVLMRPSSLQTVEGIKLVLSCNSCNLRVTLPYGVISEKDLREHFRNSLLAD